ncbi:GNAT family N-acetyltransferase [Nonomuraea sediminis]|uniref:GNAT family N-acetyltransferase n=1 Tax=Nonomuraea sediminis TaxID=2835864 RepID=UPI001BDD8C4A
MVHLQAFGDHGAVVGELVDTLRGTITPDTGISLVAENAGRVIGHIMFTPGLLDAPRRLVQVQVLSPLAVAPEYQRQGVGSALVRRGLELLAGVAAGSSESPVISVRRGGAKSRWCHVLHRDRQVGARLDRCPTGEPVPTDRGRAGFSLLRYRILLA